MIYHHMTNNWKKQQQQQHKYKSRKWWIIFKQKGGKVWKTLYKGFCVKGRFQFSFVVVFCSKSVLFLQIIAPQRCSAIRAARWPRVSVWQNWHQTHCHWHLQALILYYIYWSIWIPCKRLAFCVLHVSNSADLSRYQTC